MLYSYSYVRLKLYFNLDDGQITRVVFLLDKVFKLRVVCLLFDKDLLIFSYLSVLIVLCGQVFASL